MYIKKPVLIICAILLIALTVCLTLGFVNPFGFDALDDFLRFSSVVRVIDQNYYEEPDREELLHGALSGVAQVVEDPYTGYLWGDDAIEYMEDIEGSYHGIGIYIENNPEDNTIEIVSAIAGTPAEKAGLTTGDKILKIDGVSYMGQQISEATTVMRGPAGTNVTLTILRKDSGTTKDFILTRQEIEIQCVTGGMLTETIGRINITQFNTGTATQFFDLYQSLKEKGMQSLIMDLRNNPGGLMEEAVEIANLFVEEGKVIVYTEDRFGNKEEYTAVGEAEKMSIVLLTNQGSASASEVLTGALKDYGVGYQIGEKTYGKGVVQGVYQTGEDAILSVTVARYFTPKGVCIHEKGIAPDEEISMDVEKYRNLTKLAPKEDEHLQAAMEYLRK